MILQELAKRITSESKLRDVAVRGLGISSETVEKHLEENPKNYDLTGYRLLWEWVQSQRDIEAAQLKIKKVVEFTNT